MRKFFFQLLILLFMLSSCNKPLEKEMINEFIIYGYSGYVVKDSVKYIYDSTKLNIHQYFEFKKDSGVRIALRPYYEKAFGYYTFHLKDSFDFSDLLNKVLLNKTFLKEYYCQDGLCLYDGYYYTMYFKTNKNKETYIHYIPHYLTDSLSVLHDFFNESIKSKSLLKSKAFKLNEISEKEIVEMYIENPPPPPPETLELKVKFTAPVVINDK